MTSSKANKETSLQINPGTRSPKNRMRKSKNKPTPQLSASEYVEGILKGNRVVLSRAITLIESTLSEHGALSLEIIEKCLPHTGNSIRVGITGVPGVGKSTFIESLGKHLTEREDRKVAVLAIDPTSIISRGSILGDKTRMERLSTDPRAFIRPSPTAGSLGGVTKKTRETILLCEAAGFNVIIVETVGVGQSETAVSSMVDFFLLLMLAGAGDELQGIKRGIMEMADAIAITKADGENEKNAERARKEFQGALNLFPRGEMEWERVVLTCSALTGRGIEEIWGTVKNHNEILDETGLLQKKRKEQERSWLYDNIRSELEERFYSKKEIAKALKAVEGDVLSGKISPFSGARKLLEMYFKKN